MATDMSGVPCCGIGDGHKHGCLDDGFLAGY